jgi:hypothetical protein
MWQDEHNAYSRGAAHFNSVLPDDVSFRNPEMMKEVCRKWTTMSCFILFWVKQGKDKTVSMNDMKAAGEAGGLAALIFNLGVRWRGVFSCMPQPQTAAIIEE